MFFQTLDLTTALRPELLPEETLLFVQDGVGLYEGKYKILEYQNGHVYLTSHRICYVDNVEPRKCSTAIELKNVERHEFYAGFLKSSPKITLYPKPAKRSSIQPRSPAGFYNAQSSIHGPSRSATASPFPRGGSPLNGQNKASNGPRLQNVTWICPICSFSNLLPTNFDPTKANAQTPLPPCLACGIKPPLAHILKAAISSASSRQPIPPQNSIFGQPLLESHQQYNGEAIGDYDPSFSADDYSASQSLFRCPRCTFENHPSLLSCELCGASLVSSEPANASLHNGSIDRIDSPGPTLDGRHKELDDNPDLVKISFRVGGEKVFHERLKGAMVQRKWLLQNAPQIPLQRPRPIVDTNGPHPGTLVHFEEVRPKAVGIAGLERLGLERRKNNEMVIGNAFEDLEALMTSAKEIIALAESFAEKTGDRSTEASTLLKESAAALGMITTKEMLGSSSGTDSLYLSELSRNLAEYLTDDRQNILKKEGGIMSLVDLWALFNRARSGVEVVSSSDFEKAARLWGKLGLPVRLREFKNGLLVVQPHDWTDDKTIAELLAWLQELHIDPPPGDPSWDWQAFGRGVTAQETARRFGWSVGVATEELAMAEEKGVLCREAGMEGLLFWENWIVQEFDSDSGVYHPNDHF